MPLAGSGVRFEVQCGDQPLGQIGIRRQPACMLGGRAGFDMPAQRRDEFPDILLGHRSAQRGIQGFLDGIRGSPGCEEAEPLAHHQLAESLLPVGRDIRCVG